MITHRHWMMATAAIFACLLMGWYIVLEVGVVVVALSLVINIVIRAKERRDGESWNTWLGRIVPEIFRNRHSTAALHAVLLSCGHRGWVQRHDAPQPGDHVFCCHKRFGPAELVEVLDVGVEMYGFTPAVIRFKEEQPVG